MADSIFIGGVRSKGSDITVARVRWAPSSAATQTLTEASGVTSVTRSGAGAYTITLTDSKVKDLQCLIQVIENDTTHYHVARVESISLTAGTITVSHKSVAFASVASGPSGSDTVDQLQAVITYRMVD